MLQSNGTKLALELSLRITQLDPDGRQYGNNNRLEISDRIELPPMGFLELAGVLARFHELAETIERERA